MKKEASLTKLLTQAKHAALKLEANLKDRENTCARLTTTIAAITEENLTLGGKTKQTPKEPNEKPVYPIPDPLALNLEGVAEQLKKIRPIDIT